MIRTFLTRSINRRSTRRLHAEQCVSVSSARKKGRVGSHGEASAVERARSRDRAHDVKGEACEQSSEWAAGRATSSVSARRVWYASQERRQGGVGDTAAAPRSQRQRRAETSEGCCTLTVPW